MNFENLITNSLFLIGQFVSLCMAKLSIFYCKAYAPVLVILQFSNSICLKFSLIAIKIAQLSFIYKQKLGPILINSYILRLT